MNLLERAETKRETFYKLTNSRDVPEAPSGNRNLIRNSTGDLGSLEHWVHTSVSTATVIDSGLEGVSSGFNIKADLSKITSRTFFDNISFPKEDLSQKTYVVSGYFKNNKTVATGIQFWIRGSSDARLFAANITFNLPADGKWHYFTATGKGNGTVTNFSSYPRLQLALSNGQNHDFDICKMKVEYGNIPTDWSPAPEDLGWSSTPLVPTQSQRYLWKFDYIYYSDGSVETTQPVNISIAGEQGIPGKPGTDGKTPYVHFAYADDNRGTNLSFTDKNQQYQGYYSDYTEANSTDYKKYTWVDRLANVQIDQLNLIGAFNLTPQNATFDKTDYTLTSTTTTNTKDGFLQLQFFDEKNVVFTEFGLADKVGKFAKSFKITKAYEKFRIKINGNASDASVWCYDKDLLKLDTDYVLSGEVLSLSSDGRGNGGQIKHLKIQRGKLATGFSKAPQDVDSDINSKADSVLTQEQLNALAEQDNLIKAEMKAKASIDTVDKWITAYENYVKANDADKAKSERALKEASERIVQMKYEVNDLKLVWEAIDRFMSFQNEGLVIGKKDGSAYAKFSDDRISLFSGSSEVMYISQGTLNIANGIFTKTIQIGHFRFETHPADKDMLVLRYLGG